VVKRVIGRRDVLRAGVVAAGSVAGLASAIRAANRYGLIPPDHGGIYGIGETLTYAAHRLVVSPDSMAREFSRADISTVAPAKGRLPRAEAYQQLARSGFADWRLTLDGLVARPGSLSLLDLKRFRASTHILHQACEEGWSFIAEWTGVPLFEILHAVDVQPRARYVVFFGFDRFWESIDMADAWHPQTLLAYEMNGEPLPAGHGAPVRLRVARQLGFKSVKYLSRILVTDTLEHLGKGLGSIAPEYGYPWYGGI
jgi:DMSO/TMAO reductase YedYZ molybdopterin-dependent catalytic subunit